MVEIIIWDPMERLLMGVSITVFFITAYLFLNKSVRSSEKEGRSILYGYAGFNIGCGIRNIAIFLSEFMIIGHSDNGSYIGDYSIYEPVYEIFISLAHISFIIGCGSFIFGIEFFLKKTKCLLSIVPFAGAVVLAIAPFSLELLIMPLLYGYSFSMGFLLSFFFIKWAKQEFKLIQFFFIMSFGLFAMGIIYTYPLSKMVMDGPLWLGAMFFIFSSICMILPLEIKTESLSKIRIFYLGLFIALLTSGFAVYVYYIIYPPFIFIATIFVLVISNTVVIRSYKFFKLDYIESKDVRTAEALSIFSKPKRMTEEEVSISKERKTCLVCKGKISGKNFVCRECEAFYCNKCYLAIVELENSCWACEVILDKLKPVKKQKRKESTIDIDTKHKITGNVSEL